MSRSCQWEVTLWAAEVLPRGRPRVRLTYQKERELGRQAVGALGGFSGHQTPTGSWERTTGAAPVKGKGREWAWPGGGPSRDADLLKPCQCRGHPRAKSLVRGVHVGRKGEGTILLGHCLEAAPRKAGLWLRSQWWVPEGANCWAQLESKRLVAGQHSLRGRGRINSRYPGAPSGQTWGSNPSSVGPAANDPGPPSPL